MDTNKMFPIYRDDPDPVVHQIAKLALTTLGSWLTVKLIEIAYNKQFGLTKPTKGQKFNAKRQITYTDFNDEEVTETFYFNISKPELIELEVEYSGGFTALINRIIETTDPKQLVEHFKRLILLAYGKKSDDGKSFVKNDALRAEFENTAAYQALFTEMATVEGAAEKFFQAVLPKDLTEPKDQDKPDGPPRAIATTEAPQ